MIYSLTTFFLGIVIFCSTFFVQSSIFYSLLFSVQPILVLPSFEVKIKNNKKKMFRILDVQCAAATSFPYIIYIYILYIYTLIFYIKGSAQFVKS